jgi:hypothetical protein
LLLTAVAAGAEPQVLTVQADGDLGPFPSLASGFLHGLDENGALDSTAAATLSPGYWRLYKWVTYDFAAAFEAKITYGLSSSYAWAHGGFPNARPWENWAGWEQYVADRVTAILYWFPQDRPAFYDVWNEPDLAYFWSGTYEQLLELFARTDIVVRGVDPHAKLVGPSVAKYIPHYGGVSDVVQFAIDLDREYGIRLDALSWHENDSGVFGAGADMPEDIPGHAASIRSRLAAYFPPDYQPELHVNEYAGNRVHLSPGYNVGYLYYLMEADVDWASRACWYVYSGEPPNHQVWSDCWSGLDGMFMEDGFTPQIVYWVYDAAVRMLGGVRLPTTSPAVRTNVLASRLDADEEIRILVGRHEQQNLRDVLVRVENLPWSFDAVCVEAGRIPHFPALFNDPPQAIPWPEGLVDTWSAVLPVVGGRVEIGLNAFTVNDAWSVVISRDPTVSVAETERAPAGLALHGAFPNPFAPRTEIRLTASRLARVRLDLYDVAGRRVMKLWDGPLPAGRHSISWDGTDAAGHPVPAGVYFVRLSDGERTATAKLVRESR